MKRSRLGSYLGIASLVIIIVSLIISIIISAGYISELIAFLVIIIILPLLSGVLGIKVAIIYRDFIPLESMERPIRRISEEPEKVSRTNYLMKISLFGDPCSCNELLRKYSSNRFLMDTKLTIGVDFYSKRLYRKGKTINMQLWDMTEVENKYGKYFILGSSGAIIIYDITNLQAFKRLTEWVQFIQENTPDIPIFLIGNNIELEESREVSREAGLELTQRYNLSSFEEVSTRTGQNIEEVFQSLIDDYLIKVVDKK